MAALLTLIPIATPAAGGAAETGRRGFRHRLAAAGTAAILFVAVPATAKRYDG